MGPTDRAAPRPIVRTRKRKRNPTHANEIAATHHARTRSQQRGIRFSAMEVLLEYGTTKMSHRREVIFMDQAGRRRARAALGEQAFAQIEARLDIYLVLTGDGSVLTCVHRDRALRVKHSYRLSAHRP